MSPEGNADSLTRIKQAIKSKVFIAVLLSTLCFATISILCTQVYNSDDDSFMLYTLAGGYGIGPSNILHYTKGWNPILFWPISRLFASFPHFNWYSFLLFSFQFFATVNLAYTFLNLFKRFVAFIAISVFFLFFGSFLLQHLSVSNTSLLLSISGCTTLLAVYLQDVSYEQGRFKELIIPVGFLLISCMLRAHTMVLFAFFSFIAGLILLPKSQLIHFVVSFIVVGAILFVIDYLQIIHYEKVIPNAKTIEKRRNAYFYLANHPTDTTNRDTGIVRIENAVIRSWFVHDTDFIKQRHVDAYIRKYSTNRLVDFKKYSLGIYWFVINERVYFIFIGIIASLFIVAKAYKPFKQWLFLFFVAATAFLYLFLFVKVTSWVLMGIIAFLFISALLTSRGVDFKLSTPACILLSLLLLNMVWIVKRIAQYDSTFRRATVQTNALLKEIGNHPNTLFISTGNFFQNGFYIWDTPIQYPLRNIIHKELFLTDSYQHILTRFQISDLVRSIPTQSNIVLFEDTMPFYKEYYQAKLGWKVERREASGFKTMKVYQLKIVQ